MDFDSAIPFRKQAAAVDKAAEHSVELIRKFASMDPRDSENNAWNDPERILQQLDQARTQLATAWDVLQQAIDAHQAEAEEKKPSVSDDDLRASYIDMITDSFADVLEEMRQKETDLDIEILADCLQSGLELMSQDDKDLFLEQFETSSHEDNYPEGLTPHEQRRRELGYNFEGES
jgi:Mg2+ and Co2+ transporter CorA